MQGTSPGNWPGFKHFVSLSLPGSQVLNWDKASFRWSHNDSATVQQGGWPQTSHIPPHTFILQLDKEKTRLSDFQLPCSSGTHQLWVMMATQEKTNWWRNVPVREGQMEGVATCGLRVTDGDSVALTCNCTSIPSSIVTTGYPEWRLLIPMYFVLD